jgi:DNA mismatch repair protein MutS
LELFRTASEGGTALVDVVDACRGPMGARLLRRWLAFPLTDRAELEARHSAVAFAQSDRAWAQKAGDWVAEVHDLERVATRCATRRIGPRELLRLADGLRAADELRTLVQTDHPLGMGEWPDSTAAANAILAVIHPDAPVSLSKGGVIAPGVLAELDELRDLQSDAQGHLDALLAREQARTGIPSLRIASNGVFGYYLEVRNTHADKVPSDWIRKQTLVNAERYITPELKTLEEKLLQANDRIAALEGQLYQRLVDDLQAYVAAVLVVGSRVAEWDVLLGFADLAVRHGWARPTFAHEHRWEVREGRHPVIERVLPAGQSYIPNDVVLDSAGERMWMITGPNMSGKSALLRQTALHAILAQSGCFVPASHAELPLLDRLFVRVGASDNVSQGESTFMVEMTETASILHNLTPRSLVLLDEIGRGTATYDGISLAQAIAEYLHDHPGKPLVLFATHYHELNALASRWPGIANRHVAVQESNGKVVFLRTLVEGGSEHSFGLHVARMAGMPPSVVHRAGDLLQDLEAQRDGATAGEEAEGAPRVPGVQLSFIQWEDPAEKRLRSELDQLDLNALTPMDALMMLNRWKNQG